MQIREAIESLLQCANEALSTPVCRSFWNPGANAPHDTCESTTNGNGQLWVGHLDDVAGWPSTTSNPITCATPFAVNLELGIVRCAMGVLQDGDSFFPDAELVTADAQQQDDDRIALKNALLCCWGVSGKDMLPPIWQPIEPQGGCVGGIWTFTIRDATCLCVENES